MKIYFVDSFCTEVFKGNPAAVCFVENEIENSIMQKIAMEIGFSETAFIKKIRENNYSIRFFSPKSEIPLCGHATLAASKIIFDLELVSTITFININNIELLIEKIDSKIKMQFPVYETIEIELPNKLLNALGFSKIIDKRYNENYKIILIEIDSSAVLSLLEPNFEELLKSHSGINGVLVTAISEDKDFDFQYRYFWPWAGTNEDPVTGGVQTFLTKYWAQKLNKTILNAFQSSSRSGTMTTELVDDKVYIYGEAVILLEGQLNI